MGLDTAGAHTMHPYSIEATLIEHSLKYLELTISERSPFKEVSQG